jgi:hypothetical protein
MNIAQEKEITNPGHLSSLGMDKKEQGEFGKTYDNVIALTGAYSQKQQSELTLQNNGLIDKDLDALLVKYGAKKTGRGCKIISASCMNVDEELTLSTLNVANSLINIGKENAEMSPTSPMETIQSIKKNAAQERQTNIGNVAELLDDSATSADNVPKITENLSDTSIIEVPKAEIAKTNVLRAEVPNVQVSKEENNNAIYNIIDENSEIITEVPTENNIPNAILSATSSTMPEEVTPVATESVKAALKNPENAQISESNGGYSSSKIIENVRRKFFNRLTGGNKKNSGVRTASDSVTNSAEDVLELSRAISNEVTENELRSYEAKLYGDIEMQSGGRKKFQTEKDKDHQQSLENIMKVVGDEDTARIIKAILYENLKKEAMTGSERAKKLKALTENEKNIKSIGQSEIELMKEKIKKHYEEKEQFDTEKPKKEKSVKSEGKKKSKSDESASSKSSEPSESPDVKPKKITKRKTKKVDETVTSD